MLILVMAIASRPLEAGAQGAWVGRSTEWVHGKGGVQEHCRTVHVQDLHTSSSLSYVAVDPLAKSPAHPEPSVGCNDRVRFPSWLYKDLTHYNCCNARARVIENRFLFPSFYLALYFFFFQIEMSPSVHLLHILLLIRLVLFLLIIYYFF